MTSWKILAYAAAITMTFLAIAATPREASCQSTLQALLTKSDYSQVQPANSWTYPGGLVVVRNKRARFIDIPADLVPAYKSGSASFTAQTKTSSMNLAIVLKGFAALLGFNPGAGFNHANSVVIAQIDASAQRIAFQQAENIIADNRVNSVIKQWMASGLKVYVVYNVLLTKRISIVSSGNLGAYVSASSTAAKCASTSSSQSDTNTSSAKGSSIAHTASALAAGVESATPSQAKSATTDLPGGSAQFCYSGGNTLTLQSKTPLVFATQIFEVQVDIGRPTLEPFGGIKEGVAELMSNPNLPTEKIDNSAFTVESNVKSPVISVSWEGRMTLAEAVKQLNRPF
ncbi:MAG: hypothetical protein ACYCO5_07170 [Acidobacteriaceae bacterium]